jgi:hypothetical protein
LEKAKEVRVGVLLTLTKNKCGFRERYESYIKKTSSVYGNATPVM